MNLIPTHNTLRNLETYRHFVRRLERGNGFENCYSDIPVIITEDSKCWLYDGHHRVCAAMSLSLEIPISRFMIIHYTYRQLEEINFTRGYVTPFDPRKECRKSFHEYKDRVMKMYKTSSSQDTIDYIWANQNLYKEPRVAQEIKDLIPKQVLVKFEGLNDVIN